MRIKYILVVLLTMSFVNAKYCGIKDPAWTASVNSSCKNGYVHGQGKATHSNGKLTFTGEFQQGVMTKGVVYFKHKPYYIGKIVKNEMHGKGICYFKDKPESCEYYKGDRIDTIYKLRFLMRQQLMAINSMVESQQRSTDHTSASYQNYNENAPAQGNSSNIGEDIGKKVLNKAVDSILSNFF